MAVDAIDSAIEIQHFDGTLEEIEPDGWSELGAEPVGPPEDWSGSVDVTVEDLPGRRVLIQNWRQEFDALDCLDDIDLYEAD